IEACRLSDDRAPGFDLRPGGPSARHWRPRDRRAPAVNVQEGTTLGAYRVMERIGRGGMATVFRAYHPALDRFVAIKVLPDFFADEPDYRERFQQEARSVARLKHPNILEIFDYGYDDGTAYLVLELVEGGTLAERVGKPMDLRDVVHLLEPLGSALDHAHAADGAAAGGALGSGRGRAPAGAGQPARGAFPVGRRFCRRTQARGLAEPAPGRAVRPPDTPPRAS